MKKPRKLLTMLLCVPTLFSTWACADMGVGEHETSFYEYFSDVLFFATDGKYHKEDIATFNASIETGEEKLVEVVPVNKYAYVAFRVAKGYTLDVEEFACHAKTDGAKETVYFDFYISSLLPTQLNIEGGLTNFPNLFEEDSSMDAEENSATSVEGSSSEESGIKEEDAIREDNKFSSMAMTLTEEWDSALLSFGRAQTVREREFIVLRIRNNCILDEEELGLLKPNPVAFTLNYLMFRFTRVQKS